MKKLMLLTLILAMMLSGMSSIFAKESAYNTQSDASLAMTLENLESEQENVSELADELMMKEANPRVDYEIDSKATLKAEIESLDASSKTYQNDLLEIMENTNPETYANLAEEQADDIVESLEELDQMEPNESLKVTERNGDTTSLEIYKLDSGAEIVVGGIDESTEQDTYLDENLFAPCAITKATWVTNKNIYKKQGKRRYSAIYYLMINGKQRGKITVTNHYTINGSSITMRSPEIWEYDYESPLEISIHKDAYKSSRTTLKKAGESFYAGAQYYVTSLKKSNVTTETSVGAEAGVTISGSTATTVEWSRNETKLHKIYAIVKLNKFTANGAYLKQSGEVQFAE